jgi:hypothetical protein
MGTAITLDVGGMTLDYRKNGMGDDHGSLFQACDLKHIPSDRFEEGDYTEEELADLRNSEIGFTRKLVDIVPRLELLGFTLGQVKAEYERLVASYSDDAEPGEIVDKMSFDEFRTFAIGSSIESFDDSFPDFDERDQRVKKRFPDAVISRIPQPSWHDHNGYSERSFFGNALRVLHPYSGMRLLAENPANLEADVVWQYGPLVDAGWASNEQFFPHARRRETFLIATEGSSDAHVLKHAIDLLRPGIADFFRFIDVSDRHPFPGTGGLLKFAEGLAKIDVHNQVVFLFDNDAEGLDIFQRVSAFKLPPNMRAIMLPELEAFRSFPARGPEGLARADINRRAASIECYLDLEYKATRPAEVIWTNFKKELGVYQGALQSKEFYVKPFLKLNRERLLERKYDTTKLDAALNALVRECCDLAASSGVATTAE